MPLRIPSAVSRPDTMSSRPAGIAWRFACIRALTPESLRSLSSGSSRMTGAMWNVGRAICVPASAGKNGLGGSTVVDVLAIGAITAISAVETEAVTLALSWPPPQALTTAAQHSESSGPVHCVRLEKVVVMIEAQDCRQGSACRFVLCYRNVCSFRSGNPAAVARLRYRPVALRPWLSTGLPNTSKQYNNILLPCINIFRLPP